MEIYISKVSIDRIVPTVMQLIILLIYFCSLSCSCFILCVYYTLYTLYTIQCTDRKAANSDLLNWMKLLVVHGSSSSKDILNCQPKVSIQWEHTSGNNFRNYQERERENDEEYLSVGKSKKEIVFFLKSLQCFLYYHTVWYSEVCRSLGYWR